MTTVTISASGTWAVPAGVYYVDLEMKGGGAGGDGGTSLAGYGGGEGGVTTHSLVAVTPRTNVSVTFPAGGVAGDGGTPPTAGTGAVFGAYSIAGGSTHQTYQSVYIGGTGAGANGGVGGQYGVLGPGTNGQPGTNGCGGGGGGGSQVAANSQGGAGGNGYLRIIYNLTTADFTSDVQTGTRPLAVTFDNTSTGGYPTTYHWTYGDGSTYDGIEELHSYATTGNFTVSLRATTAWGVNTKTVTNYITVTSIPLCFGFFIMNDRMRAI